MIYSAQGIIFFFIWVIFDKPSFWHKLEKPFVSIEFYDKNLHKIRLNFVI